MTRVFHSNRSTHSHHHRGPQQGRHAFVSYSAAAQRAYDYGPEDAIHIGDPRLPREDFTLHSRRANYPNRRNRVERRDHPPRIPERYFGVTRSHFAILKCHHHLRMLEKGLPTSLKRRAKFLADSVRPAFQNDMMTAAVEEATNVWCRSVEASLREHYDDTLKEALTHISQNALRENLLDVSINMAVKWAQRQLGRKLSDVELDKSISIIRSNQALTTDELPAQPEPRASTSVELPPQPQRLVNVSVQTEPLNDAAATHANFLCEQPHTRVLDVSRQATDQTSNTTGPTAEASIDSGLELLTSSATPSDALHQADVFEPENLEPENLEPESLELANLEPGNLEPDPESSSSEPPTPDDPIACPTPAPTTSSQPEARSATQITLFGLPAGCCTTPTSIDYSKANIIFGDSNLANFSHASTTVYAPKNGRLSALKSILTQVSTPHTDVKNFILCLSFLDSGNQPRTNFTVFRSSIYAARKIFPNATLYVLLNALPTSNTSDFQNVALTNDLIVEHKPAGCVVIQPPPRLSSNVKVWDNDFCTAVFSSLREHLN